MNAFQINKQTTYILQAIFLVIVVLTTSVLMSSRVEAAQSVIIACDNGTQPTVARDGRTATVGGCAEFSNIGVVSSGAQGAYIANIACNNSSGADSGDATVQTHSSGKYITITCSNPQTAAIAVSLAGERALEDRGERIADENAQVVEDEALPVCANTDGAGAAAGNCRDSFTRCPIGSLDEDDKPINDERYGVPTSDGRCLSFDPSNVPALEDNPILIFAARMITFLSAGIGIILTIILIIAGIRYSLARGNPQEAAASKAMIEKVVISIFMYLFAFALINWLIPGGLLN